MKIAIIGAGITGLTLAWKLKGKADVVHYEASSAPGGYVTTDQKEGFLFEKGPHSFRAKGNGAATLQLIKELGLESELITPVASLRYLWARGALRGIPKWPMVGAALRDLCTSRGKGEETIAAFTTRRFGKAVTKQMVDPLVSGIYAGDPEQLSVDACFPSWRELETEHRSLLIAALKGKKEKKEAPIFSLKRGIGSLVSTLAAQLEVRYQTPVHQIKKEDKGLWIRTGEWEGPFDQIFLAVPWNSKAPRASVAVVNCGWNQTLLQKKGFGYLVPSSEKEVVLGTIFDSAIFPQQQPDGATVLTVMLGGTRHPEVVAWSENTLIATALDALKRHLQITTQPDAMSVHLAKEAIPQYTLGHQERLRRQRDALPKGVHLVGWACDGVALNDCIAGATDLVETMGHTAHTNKK